MAVITKTHELKFHVSHKRMFKAVVIDGDNLLPKIASKAVKSIDYLQGDGGAGSIMQINFPDGGPFTYVKEMIDVVDTENLVVKYHVFDSPVLGDNLEVLYIVQKFEDSGDGGCIIKVTTEHHTKGDAQFSEEDFNKRKSFVHWILTLVEEHLIANPDVCA